MYMYTVVGLVFCYLLGFMFMRQGLSALLWVPLGFVIGLFVTAQMVLPLVLGIPRAISLVSKREMRGAVFGRIILTPLIWLVLLTVGGFFLGWFWPATADYLYNNLAFNLSCNLGMIAIVLSPLSKKSRADFREDFERSYHRFYKESDGSRPRHQDQRNQKKVEAAIKVATNLYLHTIPRSEDAPAPLQFSLPDSRFRYQMFCLSAVMRACAPTMNEQDFAGVFNGCLHSLVAVATTEFVHEYFDGPVSPTGAASNGATYLQEFLKNWQRYVELEKEDRNEEILNLICTMIQTTESNVPPGETDMRRLRALALQIHCQIPTMQGAFIELVDR